MERLQKVIAHSGYASRRRAEELIQEGKVFVNGEKITELGYKVSDKDYITINGTALTKESLEYYLLYKPRGVVSTSNDDKGRKTVVDLIDTKARVYPVGRLDYDTTGILLLTNDGELANALMHPKSNINKKYIAKVNGFLTKENLKKLENGIFIDGSKTAKAEVKLKKYNKQTNTSIVELTIHEGRNHQIKKMFEAIGLRVLKLKRETYSFLDLEGLNSGEYRRLNPKEVKKLYNEVKKDL
jgi:23S rRNA pseudouridine2605 synthase